MVSRSYLHDIQRVSGWYLMGVFVWIVSGGCLKGVWRVSLGCPNGMRVSRHI